MLEEAKKLFGEMKIYSYNSLWRKYQFEQNSHVIYPIRGIISIFSGQVKGELLIVKESKIVGPLEDVMVVTASSRNHYGNRW